MRSKLETILFEREITQTQMAKDIGIVNTLLNMIIKNRREPNEEQMLKISEYLDLKVDEIFK